MSSRTPAADEFAAINEALKQIEREKAAAEMPKVFPDYTPVDSVYDAGEVWGQGSNGLAQYTAPQSDCAYRDATRAYDEMFGGDRAKIGLPPRIVGSPYQQGWASGLYSIDPRLCPFEKLTTEWSDWHSAHAKATVYLTEFNKPTQQRTEFDKAGVNA